MVASIPDASERLPSWETVRRTGTLDPGRALLHDPPRSFQQNLSVVMHPYSSVNRTHRAPTMTHLVDGLGLLLPKYAIFCVCFLLKEETDVAGAV